MQSYVQVKMQIKGEYSQLGWQCITVECTQNHSLLRLLRSVKDYCNVFSFFTTHCNT